MSSLSKPLIYSTKADASAQPVNADQVTAVSKLSVPSINGDGTQGPEDHRIIFSLTDQGQGVNRIEWRYLNESDRDDDYLGVLSTVAVDVSTFS